MKKIFISIVVLILLISLTGCSDPVFEGVKYRIGRNDDLIGKEILPKTIQTAPDNYYTSPESVSLAVSKVIFPTVEDFITIFNLTPDEMDTHPFSTGLDTIMEDAIVAVNSSLNDPFIVSLENSQLTSLDTFQMELGKLYFGAIIQMVYYEFEMYDFALRFYVNNSGSYLARDVLVKQNGTSNWKFGYQRVSVDTSQQQWDITYQVELFDQRQTDLYYDSGDAGINPEDGDLMHLATPRDSDFEHNGYFGSFESRPILLAYGMHSADEIAQNGGGFGRIDKDIIGINLEIIYSFSGQSTCGLEHSFPLAQSGRVTMADLMAESEVLKKVYPINSVEHVVTYKENRDTGEE